LATATLLAACGLHESPDDVFARVQKNLATGNNRAALIDLKNLVREQPQDARFRLAYATALLRTGDLPTAVVAFRKARESGAATADTAVPLAEALIGTGDFSGALHELASVPQPAKAHVFALQGQALLGLERNGDARAAFEQALALEPKLVTARLGLAATLNSQSERDAAFKELERATADAPDDFRVQFARGAWFARAGRAQESQEALARAAEIAQKTHNPGQEVEARLALAETRFALGDRAGAHKEVTRLNQLAPQATPVLLLEARIEINESDFASAEKHLQVVLSQNSDDQRAKLLMGIVQYAQRDFAQADMYLTAALAGVPDQALARKLLADVKRRASGSESESAPEQARAPNTSTDPDLLGLVGTASALVGDLPAAIDYFERRQKAAPQPDQTLELAAAYLAGNRAADALTLLRQMPVTENLANRRELLLLSALGATGARDELRKEALAFAAAHPKDTQAQLVAARGLLSISDAASARTLMAAATEVDPKDSKPWLELGVLEMSQHQGAAADRAFDQALRVDPQDVGALVGKAQLELAAGNKPAAIEKLSLARKLAPGALLPRLALAQIHLAAGNLDAAEEPLGEALVLAPKSPQARWMKSALAVARGHGDEAVETLQGLAKEFPREAELRTALARAQLLAAHPDDARQTNATALAIDPANWHALSLQVALDLDSPKPAAARGMLERLQKTKAPRAIVASLEGDVAFREGNAQAAQRAYEEASGLAPSARLAAKLYAARQALGVSNANAPLRAWLERSPRDSSIRLLLAQDLTQTGKQSDAEREYNVILQSEPQNAVALNNLACLRLAAGDTKGALALAARAYEKNSQVPAMADTYGWSLVKSGRAAEAVPILRNAAAAKNVDGEIRYHFAVALADSGASAEARKQLEELLKAGTKFAAADDARRLLDTLRNGNRS
jgi:putative PEP-CTERM system TPR-repeat lipoprotein